MTISVSSGFDGGDGWAGMKRDNCGQDSLRKNLVQRVYNKSIVIILIKG
jgi:hypothetical protein